MCEGTLPYAEFGAAFFGALAAFAFEGIRRWRESRIKHLEVIFQAGRVLSEMNITLMHAFDVLFVTNAETLKKAFPQGLKPWHIRPQLMIWDTDAQLPLSQLGFLLHSYDPIIIGRLGAIQRRFLHILEMSRLRNEAHYEFQKRLTELLRQSPKIDEALMEASIGVDVMVPLKEQLESLKVQLPETIAVIARVSGELAHVAEMQFPFAAIAHYGQTFDISDAPKAVPPRWRRGLRKIVVWWHRKR
jgi:hypothetical protein